MKPYYEDDFVTLYYGDCLEQTQWLEADVLVTDPPYGIEWKGMDNYTSNGFIRSKKIGITNDETTHIRDDTLNLWGDKPAVVFGSWRQARPENTKHRLIWNKAGKAPGPTNSPFFPVDEEIYILGNGFISTSPPMKTIITTTEARSIAVAQIGHPTPKPIGLMELLIQRCPNGIIADPFAGSGATLIAARNLGRKAIGIELEEKYCEIIAKRLSQQAFNFEEL